MFDFFSKLLGYIESFWNFFVNFTESLYSVLDVLGNALTFPLQLSGSLPTIISASLLVVVSLGVAKFLIGR